GMDVLAVFDAVQEAVAAARKGSGPFFIEAVCYRYEGHFSGDTLKYRSKDERAEWNDKDPISTFRARLLAEGLISSQDSEELNQRAESEIEHAIGFAQASPYPEPSTAWEDVYAE